MFRELVDEMQMSGQGDALRDKLQIDGYILMDGSFEDLTPEDTTDAWAEYYSAGSEAVVDYLESYFGLFFEQRV